MKQIVITESQLGIVCEGCKRAAVYIVTVHGDDTTHRLYCPQCTAELLQRAAQILEDNDDDRPLHDYIETESLFSGKVISNA